MVTQIPTLAGHLSEGVFQDCVCQPGSHNRKTPPPTIILPKIWIAFVLLIFQILNTYFNVKDCKKTFDYYAIVEN